MLESIHLEGFKGFVDTTVRPLRKVNLIVGGQNVGKTSLLEAVYMALSRGQESPFRANEGGDVSRLAKSALGTAFRAIEVHIESGDAARMQTINLPAPSEFPTHAASSGYVACNWFQKGVLIPIPTAIPLYLPNQTQLVHLFGEIVVARKKRELIDLLRQVEPRLISLDAVSPDGEQRIYAEIDGIDQALPLPALGHGFGRLLYLFCTLLSTDAKVALIDEVESGVHYSALPTLLQGIKNVANQRDVQTLMTTHSWDCIRSACEVFADSPDDFQVIRLERTEDNIRAVCIGGAQMQRMMSQEMEVR